MKLTPNGKIKGAAVLFRGPAWPAGDSWLISEVVTFSSTASSFPAERMLSFRNDRRPLLAAAIPGR